ncbi:hypothetical protein C8R46DRAFT_1221983 [Mycena filopes]|nr:hypothetical protein C8R46DRAFT_1221983 [Mycena filopes]
MARSYTPPATVARMRPMHTYRFSPLDRWLASAAMKTGPERPMRSPLPDGDAMCEVYISHHLGLNGQNYMLSLGVYHPLVDIDQATPDIELARFAGNAGDPGAPVWVRRLPARQLLRFPQPLHIVAKVLEGLSDIPVGPLLWKGHHERDTRLHFENWVHKALAISPSPPIANPSRRRRAVLKWVQIHVNEAIAVDDLRRNSLDPQIEAPTEEYTEPAAHTSTETDSEEQARQLQTAKSALVVWKRREDTHTLLSGKSGVWTFKTHRGRELRLRLYAGHDATVY